MLAVACSFCSKTILIMKEQPLIQAYQHLHYDYAACLNCYKILLIDKNINDFNRISLFLTKGNEKIHRMKRINDQLREFLSIRNITLSHPNIILIIDQFFIKYHTTFTKSRLSQTSTSTSQQPQLQQQKPQPSLIQTLLQSKSKLIEENKNIQKLIQIKDKLAQSGSNFLQKIKQNEKIQKQVQNINVYKERLLETGNAMKSKFYKLKSQMKDISTQLPSIKNTIKQAGLKSVAKLGFFKKW